MADVGGASATTKEVHRGNADFRQRRSLPSFLPTAPIVLQQHVPVREEAINSSFFPLSYGRYGEQLPDAGRGDDVPLTDLSWAEPRFQERESVAPLQQESVALRLSSFLSLARTTEPLGGE